MRTSLSLGLSVLLGLASSALGCAGDHEDTSNAHGGTGGTAAASGGTANTNGGTSSGDAGTPSNGDAGSSDAGASSNGDAGASTAGTSSNDGGTSSGGAGGTSSNDGGTPNDDASAGAGGASDAAPYANVVAVTVASGSEGAYMFSVSIESADIDCSQYANWWEVLTEDGALSYRRILDHSHTDENGSSDADKPGNTFTRSGGPVPVAADTVVLVRAHMSTGGYNGTVMRGTAAEGFVQAPDIGPDFAVDVESLEPQSTSCAF